MTGVLTGAEIAHLDDSALQAQVETVNLFCRVTPAQKNRLILALKQRGHVVGYLGDGINDAPSLYSADVGLSVEGTNEKKDVEKAALPLCGGICDLYLLLSSLPIHTGSYGTSFLFVSAPWPEVCHFCGRYQGGKSAHCVQITRVESLVQVSCHIRIPTPCRIDDLSGRDSRNPQKLAPRKNHRPLATESDDDFYRTVTGEPQRGVLDLDFSRQ